MRLVVINPNSTVSMTKKATIAARLAAPGAMIEGVTCHGSPPAIQGPEDDAICRPFVLTEVDRAAANGADAIIIACFDDPALDEARARVSIPVLGIGEAGFHAAMMLGGRFSVVTTLPVAIPILEANLAHYGLAQACARVRAAGVKVLDLEDETSGAVASVSAEIARAKAEDGVGAIVLGCAGMADLAARLEAEHGLKVIDGVGAA
ncbi:aspartate/glutamate racemase family protein, partial [Pseudotabrizicola sp.]|uniref:aspartate/glutamate racemase family protein n=1 Tax=Pseudotabrizicola sp. TaxID=2939647 RepID=UPI00271E7D0F